MLEMIEMQAGRLRSDFIPEGLNCSASRFRSRIIGNMDTVRRWNSQGDKSGMDLRLRGEEEAAARLEARLSERLSGTNE